MRTQALPSPSAGPWRRGPHLTDRDRDIIRWVTGWGAVTADQVAQQFFHRPDGSEGLRAAYRRVEALAAMRLLLYQRETGVPCKVIRATRRGAEVAGLALAPAPFVAHDFQHALAVIDVAEEELRKHPGAQLITERQLRAERHRELAAGTRTPGTGRIPDAVLVVPMPSGRPPYRVAIEVDLARKDRRTVEAILHQYAFETYDLVWWFVPPQRFDRMREIVEAAGPRRVQVRTHGSPRH
jgi:hypothetical protein